ncbi:folylpolyglutamate synthase, mitochondrial-like isoform X2 [Hylaeus anthracinus]|uniref:folylpolyglutamate synthase, mitochondrial-like isoform X2 n=1 Tax=Hylaeus anthracinus TaxID=313031 RepID=UPI0023B9341C|nr:folylpolyglutamate synthase, mitochondrial-like isoform X2 [Hylaeus anthracinus]XP_054007472.1 folylpolyglutamate synthase, mitochondrial-like isoform X2 [Hylaeus anthracinus]
MVTHMYHDNSYKAALKALQGLQSNIQYLKLATKTDNSDLSNLCNTEKYLVRSGITLEKLETLSVIHVAGTKGKGSTCAYTEAILRQHGFSTGFFSSPHLVTVRERIKINGESISQSRFTHYFWKVYKKLENAKEHESDMPAYFKFLTVLMFNIFLDANIDVAIIEVGIGGLKDSTNIVRNPVCIGISSLALDHTSLLGNTIEDIAFQKSGIFKPKSIAFSVPQLPQAMRVLEKRAIEKDCSLHIVPSFKEYTWENLTPISKITNSIKQQNASLAIQLAIAWITCNNDKCFSTMNTTINDNNFYNKYKEYIRINSSIQEAQVSKIVDMNKIAVGLSSCKWPGRMQILRGSIAEFFVDGAHTIESIEGCVNWFNEVSNNRNREKRILIFNSSGNRDPIPLLTPLKSLYFRKAYFVPNIAGVENVDAETNCYLIDEQKLKCVKNSEVWGADSVVANSVFEILQEIKKDSEKEINCSNNEKFQILVTGSLHLAGAVLTILDPNLTMNTQF